RDGSEADRQTTTHCSIPKMDSLCLDERAGLTLSASEGIAGLTLSASEGIAPAQARRGEAIAERKQGDSSRTSSLDSRLGTRSRRAKGAAPNLTPWFHGVGDPFPFCERFSGRRLNGNARAIHHSCNDLAAAGRVAAQMRRVQKADLDRAGQYFRIDEGIASA